MWLRKALKKTEEKEKENVKPTINEHRSNMFECIKNSPMYSEHPIPVLTGNYPLLFIFAPSNFENCFSVFEIERDALTEYTPKDTNLDNACFFKIGDALKDDTILYIDKEGKLSLHSLNNANIRHYKWNHPLPKDIIIETLEKILKPSNHEESTEEIFSTLNLSQDFQQQPAAHPTAYHPPT